MYLVLHIWKYADNYLIHKSLLPTLMQLDPNLGRHTTARVDQESINGLVEATSRQGNQ